MSQIYDTDIRSHLWTERCLNRRSWPVTVRLDLSDRCNCHCPVCAFERADRDIDVHIAQSLLLGLPLPPRGVRSIQFSGGGEPTLHPQCFAIMELAAAEFRVGLLTNGLVRTDPADYDFLAKTCDWIRVSINAGNSDDYARRHGVTPGFFANAWLTVDELQQRARDPSTRLCYVSAGCLVDETMSDAEMYDAATLAEAHGAMAITFRHLWAKGRAIRFRHFARKLRDKVEGEGFRVLWPDMRQVMLGWSKRDRPHVCVGSRLETVVTADGRMWTCGHMRYHESRCLGDLNESTFAEIWQGDQRAEILAGLPNDECIWPCCYAPINHQMQSVLESVADADPHCYFI